MNKTGPILTKVSIPIFYIILCGLFFSCTKETSYDKYVNDLNQWKEDREASLIAPYGWPSVVGLFWLKNSLQYFGSAIENDFILPETAPSSFGIIERYDDSIVMKAYPNLKVQVDGNDVSTIHMLSDQDENGPTRASWKSLQWYIIKRQEKYFLRVKDSLSIYRSKFEDIPYFPADTSLRFMAKFIPAENTDSTAYHNTIGMSFIAPIAGYLSFTFKDSSYQLTALQNDEDSYFVIFADNTTGESAYAGGRYLYPQKADATGTTWLDFNRAINPPCVFTPFATCPLPPKENWLPFSVTAGEKNLKLY